MGYLINWPFQKVHLKFFLKTDSSSDTIVNCSSSGATLWAHFLRNLFGRLGRLGQKSWLDVSDLSFPCSRMQDMQGGVGTLG